MPARPKHRSLTRLALGEGVGSEGVDRPPGKPSKPEVSQIDGPCGHAAVGEHALLCSK